MTREFVPFFTEPAQKEPAQKDKEQERVSRKRFALQINNIGTVTEQNSALATKLGELNRKISHLNEPSENQFLYYQRVQELKAQILDLKERLDDDQSFDQKQIDSGLENIAAIEADYAPYYEIEMREYLDGERKMEKISDLPESVQIILINLFREKNELATAKVTLRGSALSAMRKNPVDFDIAVEIDDLEDFIDYANVEINDFCKKNFGVGSEIQISNPQFSSGYGFVRVFNAIAGIDISLYQSGKAPKDTWVSSLDQIIEITPESYKNADILEKKSCAFANQEQAVTINLQTKHLLSRLSFLLATYDLPDEIRQGLIHEIESLPDNIMHQEIDHHIAKNLYDPIANLYSEAALHDHFSELESAKFIVALKTAFDAKAQSFSEQRHSLLNHALSFSSSMQDPEARKIIADNFLTEEILAYTLAQSQANYSGPETPKPLLQKMVDILSFQFMRNQDASYLDQLLPLLQEHQDILPVPLALHDPQYPLNFLIEAASNNAGFIEILLSQPFFNFDVILQHFQNENEDQVTSFVNKIFFEKESDSAKFMIFYNWLAKEEIGYGSLKEEIRNRIEENYLKPILKIPSADNSVIAQGIRENFTLAQAYKIAMRQPNKSLEPQGYELLHQNLEATASLASNF